MIKFDAENHKYYLGQKVIPSVTGIMQATKVCPEYFDNYFAERGTRIHSAISAYSKGEFYELSSLDAGFLSAWIIWAQDKKIIDSEKIVFHPEFLYCGTIDYCREENGKRIIGDYKTGNPDKSHIIQLGGYCLAYQQEFGGEIQAEVIYLKQDGSFSVEIIDWESGAEIFKACLIIYNYRKNRNGRNGNS